MKCDKPNCDHPHDIQVDLPEPKLENENIIEEPKITVNDISDEKPEESQKITIKEVPQDNSQKPPVTFKQFNGKLLPSAKRYNI